LVILPGRTIKEWLLLKIDGFLPVGKPLTMLVGNAYRRQVALASPRGAWRESEAPPIKELHDVDAHQ